MGECAIIIAMKKEVNFLYLLGGIIMLTVGCYYYFVGRSIFLLWLVVIGITYLLYSFQILPENKYMKLPFSLILIASFANMILDYGAGNNFWPPAMGGELSSTSTTYLFFLSRSMLFLGFILFVIGLVMSLFKKQKI